MRAYRHSVHLKLGLIVFAVSIAIASLVYTKWFVDRLRDREQFVIRLWAHAQEHLAAAATQTTPYVFAFHEIEALLAEADAGGASLDSASLATYGEALDWARSMALGREVTLAGEIVTQGHFGIPAIVTDSTRSEPLIWQSVPAPDSLGGLDPQEREEVVRRLMNRVRAMQRAYEPIVIQPNDRLKQYMFYDDSRLIRDLTIFPFVQILFVALFVVVGYLGFSHVRRSEQSNLWVGMAKEAAHQLGTPISSLMGWTQWLREDAVPESQRRTALEEMENDVARLQRVANRFSDIGSLPKLERRVVASVIETSAGYLRKRMPSQVQRVDLEVAVDRAMQAMLNAELFEWVIENLLENALDAIESSGGNIRIEGRQSDRTIQIDVEDTGKGIDRKNWKLVFQPGYSTKRRGWGLGLSLAKRIVEDYHGGVLVLLRSRPGEGTTFRITLPAAAPS